MHATNEKQTEEEIKQWAATMRHGQFSSRQDFNFEVCTRLMAAGLTPTPALVLRVGCWGQTAYVAEDVAAWNASLSESLRTRDAAIPLGARRKGNQLLEQIWELANKEVAERWVKPLQDELAIALPALAHLEVVNRDLKALSTLQAADLALRDETIAADKSLINEIGDRIAKAAEEHASELKGLSAVHLAEIAAMRDVQAAEIVVLRGRLDAQMKSTISETKRLMLQVDAARQESSKWAKEALDSNGLAKTLLSDISQLRVQAATSQGVVNGFERDIAALQSEIRVTIEAGRSGKSAPKKRVAATRRGTSTAKPD